MRSGHIKDSYNLSDTIIAGLSDDSICAGEVISLFGILQTLQGHRVIRDGPLTVHLTLRWSGGDPVPPNHLKDRL